MTKLLMVFITAISIAVTSSTAFAVDGKISKDERSKPTSRSANGKPELILSNDGETITNQKGEIVARRIDAYESVAPAVYAKRSCPSGQSWKCVKTERRYKQVCLELVGGMCLKYGVKSWLECVAYDCVGTDSSEAHSNTDDCKWCEPCSPTPGSACLDCCTKK